MIEILKAAKEESLAKSKEMSKLGDWAHIVNEASKTPRQLFHCTCTQLRKDGIPGCCDWCEFVAFDGSHDGDNNNG